MFGYITINKDELKIKDYNKYQAYYCGVCGDLKNKFGRVGQMSLSYDMTFLAMVLTSLYDEDEACGTQSCVLHPFSRQAVCRSAYTEYAADMTILLSYHNQMDNWRDDKKASAFLNAKMLKKHYDALVPKYPRQSEAIRTYMEELYACEEAEDPNPDHASGATGRLLGEIFVFREDDVWAAGLRRMGFFLGKFIYLMDAYDDVVRDIKNQSYNPLKEWYHEPDFDGRCKNILTMMMAECSREFEKLPIVSNAEILRNILYSGVWTKLEVIRKERDNAGSL